MTAQHDSIDSIDTDSAQCTAYSAPRLQRLGRVSELTHAAFLAQGADAQAYVS